MTIETRGHCFPGRSDAELGDALAWIVDHLAPDDGRQVGRRGSTPCCMATPWDALDAFGAPAPDGESTPCPESTPWGESTPCGKLCGPLRWRGNPYRLRHALQGDTLLHTTDEQLLALLSWCGLRADRLLITRPVRMYGEGRKEPAWTTR